MSFKVAYSQEACETIDSMDCQSRDQFLIWVEEKLNDRPDPRRYGRTLSCGTPFWVYDIGDFRVLAAILDG